MMKSTKLQSYNFKAAENAVLYGTPEERSQVYSEMIGRRQKLDYFMTRFLDTNDVDHLEKGSPEMKFYLDKFDEYTKVERLIRIIDNYKVRK